MEEKEELKVKQDEEAAAEEEDRMTGWRRFICGTITTGRVSKEKDLFTEHGEDCLGNSLQTS